MKRLRFDYSDEDLSAVTSALSDFSENLYEFLAHAFGYNDGRGDDGFASDGPLNDLNTNEFVNEAIEIFWNFDGVSDEYSFNVDLEECRIMAKAL